MLKYIKYMKNEIISILQKIVKKLTKEDVKISLSIPKDINHGDYTTNIALILSKQLGQTPTIIANTIAASLDPELFASKNLDKKDLISVEVVKPGFINFYLPESELLKNAQEFISNPEKAGNTEKFKNKKISVEYTDPNPFKEFHIGHVYTNTVGESVSRIFEANGAIVWRADYFGDVGMHVAKALYGLMKKFKEDNLNIDQLSKKNLKERINYLGQSYTLGSTLFEEDSLVKEEVKKINKLVFIAAQEMWIKEKNLIPTVDYIKNEKIDQSEMENIYKLYTFGRKWSLEYFDSIYDRLGMKFNGYYPESLAAERGYKLVMDHLKDGIFTKNDGAIIFEGEKFGLHTRVFINSLGLPTYEAKELGLAGWKYEDFKYDKSYIVTGSEITEYFKVLIKALSLISPDLASKTNHIPHGMVRLPEGKMSSRTGKIILGEQLLDQAVQKAINLSKHSVDKFEEEQVVMTVSSKKSLGALNHGMLFNELNKTSELVGIGAVKYAFLKSGIGKDIEFDLEKSLSLNGNSGPYLQYTYVRTQSILEKSRVQNSEFRIDKNISGTNQNDNREELLLLRKLYQFSEIVENAGETLSPNVICEYLFELAQEFNLFYQKKRIINAESGELKNLRLLLTSTVGVVVKRGLNLLGIEAPKKM